MAETLLSFGVEKLLDFLVKEAGRFQGVKDQFKELIEDIGTLSSYLKETDAKKQTSPMVIDAVKNIKEIVDDAEDIIKTVLLKEELGKTNDIGKRIRQLACVIADRRGLAFDMKAISKRIARVEKIRPDGKTDIETKSPKTYSTDTEVHLVGLEKNVEQLVGYLVEAASNQVVSIIGMGGIGKTTLARQVFHHVRVQDHFDGAVWVSMSQQFTAKYVWQKILGKLSSKHDSQKISNMIEDELQEELFGLLETSNSFIVLDGMWKKEDWDSIKPAFPSKKGWTVLLTSRNENVALHADPTCVIFKPECLTSEESWTLFQRIAFPRKDTAEFEVVEMEDVGMQMIKHCGGLPLAVNELGSLLASKTLYEWKSLCGNIGSHIDSVSHKLSRSFEELPGNLKYCFLYLAHFPKDFTIDVGNLAYYWAAEEKLELNSDRDNIREVADGYIKELAQRNMVISERDANSSRFETCHLHDMMRNVCLLKATKEDFVHIVDKSASTATSQSPCKSRRIAVHQLDETFHLKREIQNPKLRSFLFYRKHSSIKLKASGFSFTRVQLMRVLDLSYAEFKGGKLPSSIGKLIHLRYLSLYLAEVSRLPSSMRNLKLLLYLNLHVDTSSPLYMAPNILKEMRELAYLSLPRNIHNKVKLELGNLVTLKTLENFSTEHCSVRDLHRMTRLESLSIRFNGKGCTMETISSSISELRHLENLTIDGDKFVDEKGVLSTEDEEECVLNCDIHLKRLSLAIYMPKLPDEQHFPSRLTTLSLKGCCLAEDPMPVLEKLLHLDEVKLMGRSYAGRRMACSGGGFPQLQILYLYGLEEWEEWTVEEGSMPLLHSLTIYLCEKLKELPDGLQFIYSLKNLRMGEEWTEKLSEGGEEYYKVQHIPLVQFD